MSTSILEEKNLHTHQKIHPNLDKDKRMDYGEVTIKAYEHEETGTVDIELKQRREDPDDNRQPEEMIKGGRIKLKYEKDKAKKVQKLKDDFEGLFGDIGKEWNLGTQEKIEKDIENLHVEVTFPGGNVGIKIEINKDGDVIEFKLEDVEELKDVKKKLLNTLKKIKNQV